MFFFNDTVPPVWVSEMAIDLAGIEWDSQREMFDRPSVFFLNRMSLCCLVVEPTPLKNMTSSVGMMTFPILMETYKSNPLSIKGWGCATIL